MKFTDIKTLPTDRDYMDFFAVMKVRVFPRSFTYTILRKRYIAKNRKYNYAEWELEGYYTFINYANRDKSFLGTLESDWMRCDDILAEKAENTMLAWYSNEKAERYPTVIEPEFIYTAPTSDWHTWYDPTGTYGTEKIDNPFYLEKTMEMDGKNIYIRIGVDND